MDATISMRAQCRPMKPTACLAFAFLLGCQSGDAARSAPAEGTRASPGAAASTPGSAYAKDIEALVRGHDPVGRRQDSDARTLTIANWLAANLTTPESRKFLVQIQPLAGEAKAQALETEAKRVGLAGCALAAEWRAPTP